MSINRNGKNEGDILNVDSQNHNLFDISNIANKEGQIMPDDSIDILINKIELYLKVMKTYIANSAN